MTVSTIQVILILLYLAGFVAVLSWASNLEFWGGPVSMLHMGARYIALGTAVSFFLTAWIHIVGASSPTTIFGYAIGAAFVTSMVGLIATVATIGRARLSAMSEMHLAESIESVTLEVFDEIDTHGIGMISRNQLIAAIVRSRPGRNRTRTYLQKLLNRFDIVASIIERKTDRETGDQIVVRTVSRQDLVKHTAWVRKRHAPWQTQPV